MNFSFSFRLDKRRRLDNGNFSIKVNLHSYIKNRNYDFSIKPAFTSNGERIEFNCTEAEWKSIWIEKNKLNSFGEVIGETVVHGRKFELRVLLKIKHDILNEIIFREGITSHIEVRNAFYAYQPKSEWNNVYSGLKDLHDYHFKRESFNYAGGFLTTRNNLKEYLNGKNTEWDDIKPFRFTDVTVEWLKKFEQKRRITVGASAVRKDLVNLRTAYNKEAKQHKELNINYPFGVKNNGYSMPQGKVKNVGLSQEDIDKIKNFNSDNWYLQTARDFFLFSYALRGANLTDIARLEKDAFMYTRKKTAATSGVQLKIRKFTPEMQNIIERHKGSGKYVFNIIDDRDSEREKLKKIKAKVDQITDQCKNLAQLLGLSRKFSFQWARHTVGFKLASENLPMKAIQETFGHTSQRTTEGYIRSVFDENEKDIDEALEI